MKMHEFVANSRHHVLTPHEISECGGDIDQAIENLLAFGRKGAAMAVLDPTDNHVHFLDASGKVELCHLSEYA